MKKTVNLHVWHTGEVLIDRALAFKEKTWHPAPSTGWLRPRSRKMWVTVSAYRIEHPKGRILVDTGWHEDMRLDQKKHLGRLAQSVYQGRLPEAQSVRERLASLRLGEKDLDYVILAHLHSDHVSSLRQVSGAGRIMTSEIELRAAVNDAGFIRYIWRASISRHLRWRIFLMDPSSLDLIYSMTVPYT